MHVPLRGSPVGDEPGSPCVRGWVLAGGWVAGVSCGSSGHPSDGGCRVRAGAPPAVTVQLWSVRGRVLRMVLEPRAGYPPAAAMCACVSILYLSWGSASGVPVPIRWGD